MKLFNCPSGQFSTVHLPLGSMTDMFQFFSFSSFYIYCYIFSYIVHVLYSLFFFLFLTTSRATAIPQGFIKYTDSELANSF